MKTLIGLKLSLNTETITNINLSQKSRLHIDVNPIADDLIVADDETSVSSEVDCTINSDGGCVKDRKSSTKTKKRPWSKCAEKVTEQQLDEAPLRESTFQKHLVLQWMLY